MAVTWPDTWLSSSELCQLLHLVLGQILMPIFIYDPPEAIFGATFYIQATIIYITSPDLMKVSCRFVN